LFAYGHHYLGGKGDMLLIYPASRDVSTPLQSFEMKPGLQLWVLPFDLDEDRLNIPKDWPSDFLPLKIQYE
jgi:5-methylcytosine-specific restriction enzyme subunit McrC